ncbi:TPA: tape measure protein [Streptococcus suis]
MADGTVVIAIDLDGAEAESGFQKIKSLLGGAGDSAKKTGSVFKQMLGANIIGNALTKGISAIGSGVRSMAGELNSSKKAWDTFEGNMRMLGNSDAEIAKAKSAMQDYATQTIYSASDMASTYSQLAAVGVDNVDQLVTGFGGLAASAENPAQAMKSLSMQATQMAAKPKVAWQDFKIMMEQSPAGMAAVAKSMGMSLDEMIAKIQDGELATNDFFDAVKEVGNNDHFSKMATQFKTVDQAMDGLKESLANKLQPAFGKLSEYGIKAIEKISDVIDKFDFSGLETAIDNVANGFKDFFKGLGNTQVFESLKNAAVSLRNAFMNLFGAIKGDGTVSFEVIGQAIGNFVSKIANAITKVADFVAKLDPGVIRSFAKGVAIAIAAFKGFNILSRVASLFRAFKSGGVGATGAVGKASAKLGSLIKNTFSGVANVIKSTGVAIKTVLQGVAGVVKALGPAIATAAKGIGTGLATAFRGLASAIAMVPVTKMLAFGAAIALVIAALALLATQGDGVKLILEGLGSVVESLGVAIGTILKAALEGIGSVLESLGTAIGTVVESIGVAIASIITAATPLVGVLGGIFTEVVRIISDAIVRIVQAIAPFIPAITHMVEVVVTNLPSIIDAFSRLVTSVGLAITQVVTAVANGAVQIINALVPLVAQIGTSVTQIVDAFGRLVESVGTALANVVTAVTDGVANIIAALVPLVDEIGNTALEVGTAIEGIVTAMSEGFVDVVDAVTTGVADVISEFSGFVSELSGFVEELSRLIISFGDAVTQVIDALSRLGESVQGIIDEVGDTAKEIAEAFKTMTEALAGLEDVDLLGIGAGLAAISASLAGINLTGNIGGTSEGMSKLSEALNGIPDISTMGSDFTSLKDGLDGLGEVGTSAGEGITDVKEARDGIYGISALAGDFEALKTAFTGLGPIAPSASRGLTQIKTVVSDMPTGLNVAKIALTQFKIALTNLNTGVVSSMSSIKTSISTAMTGVKTSISSNLTGVKTSFTTSFNSMKTTASTNMTGVKTAVSTSMSGVKTAVTSSMSSVKSSISSSMNSAKSAVTSATSGMKSAISSAFNSMKSTVSSSMNAMVSTMQSAGSRGVGVMRSVGAQIGNGLAAGMRSALGAVTAAANALVAQAVRAAQAKAMIHSPSRLFANEVGRYLPQGMAVGIDKNAHYATDSIQSVIDDMTGMNMNLDSMIGVGNNSLSKQIGLNLRATGQNGAGSNTSNTYNQHYTLNANGNASSDFYSPENMRRLLRELAYYTKLEGGLT